MTRQSTSFYLFDHVTEILNKRSRDRDFTFSRSAWINRIVERYDWIMAKERPDLTEGEWALLVEALKGVDRTIATLAVLEHIVPQLASPAQAEKHGVDLKALVKKLAALRPAQRAALADRVELIQGGFENS